MLFFSKLFSRKQNSVAQTEKKPRYVILNDNDEPENKWIHSKNGSYRILDTKENMKLGLHINHSVYDAGAMPHEEYPDGDKNGVTVSVEVVVGDFYKFPYDEAVLSFYRSAKVFDKDMDRLATDDDADFTLYTKLQKEIKDSEHPEQAILLHTLLKVIKSDILTSPERVTKEYIEQQKKLKEAEHTAKEEALRAEKEKYQQELLKKAEKQKADTQQKQAKISAYMRDMKKIIWEK